ncbi:RDD family protein [Kribbella solani]|uniref:RDD family protein n=1 Tax=Kribbella solani TaxID=236067 RepID=UPI0029B1F29B|nr:RDD family protein [Kribbella solani]MDX3004357.1 RDD family protein [Kribbella solani]
MSVQEGGDVVSQLVTGEAVVLQVRIARMPTRALACAIDMILQGVVLVVLISLLAGFLLGGESSEALAFALIFIVVLVVVIGYRVVMETLTRGRTLGKMVLGLKVVRDDGSSIRFRHALVRTLLWFFVDFAPWFAASPGIVASLMNKQGKRIGDMVAGTVVIRERHQAMASPPLFVPGHLVQWAQSLELSRLSDELANATRDYLARYTELLPGAQIALGEALAARVAAVTAPAPPAQLIAPAYLSAVLAERRRRELHRLSTQRPLHTGPFAPPATFTPYAPPPNAPAAPYAIPAGPFAPPSPYGAQPPPPPAPVPFPPPATPGQQSRPVTVNAQGWAAPGSGDSGQWS